MSIMALPCPLRAFSRCALFTKATPPTISICNDFNCYINEGETPKTCLTNHKDSISHHITPLVINSLGGGHTHASILTSQTKAISRNQSCTSQRLARTWFNKLLYVYRLIIILYLKYITVPYTTYYKAI